MSRRTEATKRFVMVVSIRMMNDGRGMTVHIALFPVELRLAKNSVKTSKGNRRNGALDASSVVSILEPSCTAGAGAVQ